MIRPSSIFLRLPESHDRRRLACWPRMPPYQQPDDGLSWYIVELHTLLVRLLTGIAPAHWLCKQTNSQSRCSRGHKSERSMNHPSIERPRPARGNGELPSVTWRNALFHRSGSLPGERRESNGLVDQWDNKTLSLRLPPTVTVASPARPRFGHGDRVSSSTLVASRPCPSISSSIS